MAAGLKDESWKQDRVDLSQTELFWRVKGICTAENSTFVLQGMPTSTMAMKFDSDHRRALETMKGDRHKDVEKLKAEAVTSASTQQALTQKLDKVTARKSILEQEVLNAHSHCPTQGGLMVNYPASIQQVWAYVLPAMSHCYAALWCPHCVVTTCQKPTSF